VFRVLEATVAYATLICTFYYYLTTVKLEACVKAEDWQQ